MATHPLPAIRSALFALTLVALTLVALWRLPHAAHAQSTPSVDELSAVRFQPAPGRGNYLGVDGAQVRGHLLPRVGLTVDYAHRPFVLRDVNCTDLDGTDCDIKESDTNLVKYTLTGNLFGALALSDRVELNLIVPLVYSDGDTFSFVRNGELTNVGGGSTFAMADPRVAIKVAIAELPRYGLGFAAMGYGTIPTGEWTADEHFVGNSGPTFGVRGIAEWRRERVRTAVNLDGVWRKSATLLSTHQRSEMRYGAAVGYDLTQLLWLYGELQGATTFSAEASENPLEARVGSRLTQDDFAVGLAAGAGLTSGVGTPAFRIILEGAWAPQREDDDHDGIRNKDDSCPSVAEDRDGFDDYDGCPDSDNDNDGFEDGSDACPSDAEDLDNFRDDDGCPDPDNDGDGVSDGYDSCPDVPSGAGGGSDDDGCPVSAPSPPAAPPNTPAETTTKATGPSSTAPPAKTTEPAPSARPTNSSKAKGDATSVDGSVDRILQNSAPVTPKR